MPGRKWTEKETQFIRDNYGNREQWPNVSSLANHLGRSHDAVDHKAHSLGLAWYDLTRQEVGLNHQWSSYITRSRAEGKTFELTKEQFLALKQAPCHYCGASPSPHSTERYTCRTHGIDRKDPDKGYIPNNVVTCCWACNQMKGRMQYREFRAHVMQIATHMRGS